MQQSPTILIPQFREFSNLLHERLHTTLFHIEEIETKFMLISNLYDRQQEEKPDLVYAGSETQRKIVENSDKNSKGNPITIEQKRSLNSNWEFLDGIHFESGQIITEKIKTSDLIRKFKAGKLSLKDLDIGYLRDYFAKIENDFEKNEHPILNTYFDITNDAYISIPIIAFGSIDGVVHIIFSEEEIPTFQDTKTIRRIVKLFTREYEDMLLDWQVTGENMEKPTYNQLLDLAKNLSKQENENPIFKELGLQRYYEVSTPYIEKREEFNDEVSDKFKKEHELTATLSILIDSFAHNISTHTMVTLGWWFRERGEYKTVFAQLNENVNELTEKEKINLIEILGKYDENENPLVLHAKHYKEFALANPLHPLFRFLSEKATFWNAITRHTNFIGQPFSLYHVLWKDFIENPLYLGTVASTERIKKIHFHLSVFGKQNEANKGFIKKKHIKKIGKKLCQGHFATINFDDFYKNKDVKPIDEDIFIEKGGEFALLKEELTEMNIFFPGGIVGKHAFLTIIENEIRNVKHYGLEDLAIFQKDGLNIHISIHEVHVNPEDKTGNKELYKIGVSIGHAKGLALEKIIDRMTVMNEGIITDDTYRPRLGGTFQDKICASMLFNNDFNKVQDESQGRSALYYPWMKSALSPAEEQEGIITDFEMSARRLKHDEVFFKEEHSKFINEHSPKVFYKKYFHVWKASDIYNYSENHQSDEHFEQWENKNRFKFSVVKTRESFNELRTKGLTRVLIGENYDTISNAYQGWLKIWNKSDEAMAFELKENRTLLSRLIYQNGQITYLNQEECRAYDEVSKQKAAYQAIENKTEIKIAHGNKYSNKARFGNYRSYGRLKQKFLLGQNIKEAKDIPSELLYELFETLSTKVAIFDNRVVSRLPNEDKREKFFKNALNCEVYSEDLLKWKALQKEGFTKYHCLVVHLSFMEGMVDANGQKYGEGRMIDFINDQVLCGKSVEEVGDNFMLVITTGRGRQEWWDKIKNTEYVRFTTFRPIESLLAAVGDAVQIEDDIDVKYNLIKVLLGS